MDIFKSFKLDPTKIDLKKLAKGELVIEFATMGVEDKDGDVALPGFYGKQDVHFLPTHDWSHVWMGKGVTSEVGDKAVAEIKVNMEIQSARDWLSAIKFDLENGNPIGEYSYGFKVLAGGSRVGDFNGKQVRYLTPREDGTPGSKIWEVSPVVVGAGENTRTVAAKVAGKTFAEESQALLDSADSIVDRAKALAALRGKDGRELSIPVKEKLAALACSFQEYAKAVASLVSPAPAAVEEPSVEQVAARRELVRMTKVKAGLRH